MESLALSALFLAAMVNAAIPGPAVLLVVARAAEKGMHGGVLAGIGGLSAGALLLATVWAVMLGALELGPQVYEAMRWVGIAVLVVLGVHMLRAARSAGIARPRSGPGDFAAGATLVLSNPVNLVFFLALVPQFVDPSALDARLMMVTSGLVLLGSAVPLVVAAFLGATQARLAPQRGHWVVRGGGVAMLGFAGLVAVTGF